MDMKEICWWFLLKIKNKNHIPKDYELYHFDIYLLIISYNNCIRAYSNSLKSINNK